MYNICETGIFKGAIFHCILLHCVYPKNKAAHASHCLLSPRPPPSQPVPSGLRRSAVPLNKRGHNVAITALWTMSDD